MTRTHLPSPHFGFDADLCLRIAKRGTIFVDETIADTHGSTIQKELGYELIVIPSGESNKTREVKQALEDELFKRKMGRDCAILALGGGVITDLVGFTAATYMRGAPLILVPTTLLAMVDASIGGKTGVNTPFGKNLVGSFYLPKAIFIDFRFLDSLPEKEMKNGLSEILKYGLIADPSIWERCGRWESELESLVRSSISCKMKIVEADFDETTGMRRILNFGHTVGHALELLFDFKMAHGEAVALGCMAESYLSHLTGHLSAQDLERILGLYRKLGYTFKKFDAEAFRRALMWDKKSKNGTARFVLIHRIGECLSFDGEYCTSIESTDLDKMTEWMNRMSEL